jgi:Glycosyltransferase family 25 (LPS biosynthesis protein)
MATRRMPSVAIGVAFIVTVLFVSTISFFTLGATSAAGIFPKTWRLVQASVDDYSSSSSSFNYHRHSNVLSSSPRLTTLNVASRIFVINLLHRSDRRAQMELLRSVLGLEFTYVDALHSTNPLVDVIMDRVTELRVSYKILDDVEPEASHTAAPTSSTPEFNWPEDVNDIAYSFDPLGRHGSDLWEDDVLLRSSSRPASGANITLLTNAYNNDSVEAYRPNLPPHRILTAGKIACWYSHSKAIRQIAEGAVKNLSDVSVVLEDDVDMELDIRQRLAGLWDSLPDDWDIVFLGMLIGLPEYATTRAELSSFQVIVGLMSLVALLSKSTKALCLAQHLL